MVAAARAIALSGWFAAGLIAGLLSAASTVAFTLFSSSEATGGGPSPSSLAASSRTPLAVETGGNQKEAFERRDAQAPWNPRVRTVKSSGRGVLAANSCTLSSNESKNCAAPSPASWLAV